MSRVYGWAAACLVLGAGAVTQFAHLDALACMMFLCALGFGIATGGPR